MSFERTPNEITIAELSSECADCRAALQGLLDLIDWVGLEPSSDVPLHEWESIHNAAIAEARRVLREGTA